MRNIDVERKIKSYDSQLATNMNFATNKNYMINKTGDNEECVITFITDDGRLEDYTIWYEQIFKPEGVPASTCLITDYITENVSDIWLTWNMCKEMKTSGWSVVSHGATHLYSNVDEDVIREDYKSACEALKEHGLDYDLFVTPYGAANELSTRISREFYKCNCDIPRGDVTELFKPIDNYRLRRRPLMDEDDYVYQDIIDEIDYCIKNKKWLIYMGHSHMNYNAQKIADMRRLIQYIKSKGIKIVNLEEGLKLKGNVLDIGDNFNNKNTLRITSTGEILSPQFDNDIILFPVSNASLNVYKLCEIEIFDSGVSAITKFDFIELMQPTVKERGTVFVKVYQGEMGVEPDVDFSFEGSVLTSENFKGVITKMDSDSTLLEIYFARSQNHRYYGLKPLYGSVGINYKGFNVMNADVRYNETPERLNVVPTGIATIVAEEGSSFLKKTGDYISGELITHEVLPVTGYRFDLGHMDIPYRDGYFSGDIISHNGVVKSGYGDTLPNYMYDGLCGSMFFDTDLGKPVWWNGSGWIDATGTLI